MLITNIGRLVTMEPSKKGGLGVIKDAAMLVEGGEIKAIRPSTGSGRTDHLFVRGELVEPRINASGGIVLPGLIDCHTHLVHAGSRVEEFAMRARGVSYEEIARAGGGIMSTVRATRSASEDELFELAAARAREALEHGVTTLEIKSGYGLDLETELKMLRVVKRLGKELPQEFVPTFLAHMVPLGMSFLRKQESNVYTRDPRFHGDDRREYISLIIHQLLPAIAAEGLAKFCDVFVEKIAFTKDEAEKILKAVAKLGMRSKLHADQLSSGGGAGLAAKLHAVSADHLENVSKKDMSAMAKAGVTAVLIPSSTFFIGKGDRLLFSEKRCLSPYAPARELISAGVNVAVSTDYNPGTSPILNLWLAATMAITQMKLTPEEAYKGITINAARALGMEKTHGSIAVGKSADLVILDAKSEFEPFYRFDKSFVSKVIKKGKVVYEK